MHKTGSSVNLTKEDSQVIGHTFLYIHDISKGMHDLNKSSLYGLIYLYDDKTKAENNQFFF